LILLALVGGCRGYLADRLKPRSTFVAPQLSRYGVSGPPAQCVEERLTKELTVWQLRQFYDLSNRLQAGGSNPASFNPWDLVYVAGLVKDAEVGQHVRAALQECGLPLAPPAPVAVASAPPPPTEKSAEAQPTTETPAPASAGVGEPIPLWVNLGAAASGQGIAVDARSVTREAGNRQAWFRLLRINGDQIVGETGYLLRVDCEKKTITAHAGRTYGPGGALVQQKTYDKPEGPLAIEGGTVIEVAYHALCDEAK
jgi:hypothetical protein